jgi:hypothetical protein
MNYTVIVLCTLLIYCIGNHNQVYSQLLHRAQSPSSSYVKYDINYTETYLNKKAKINNDSDINNSKLNNDSSILSYLTTITSINEYFFENKNDFNLWFISILATALIGFSGILPVIILPQLAANHSKLCKY